MWAEMCHLEGIAGVQVLKQLKKRSLEVLVWSLPMKAFFCLYLLSVVSLSASVQHPAKCSPARALQGMFALG